MLFCETGAPGAAGLRFASVGAGRMPPARSTVRRAYRAKSLTALTLRSGFLICPECFSQMHGACKRPHEYARDHAHRSW